MPRTSANEPVAKCKFRITISGFPSSLGFSKVAGLSREVEVINYSESTSDTAMKIPGREKIGDITCERGVYPSSEVYDLYKKTLTDPNFRGTVLVELLNKVGETQRSWKLAECWCSKWEGPDFDAGSADIAIEKITLQCEKVID